MTPVAPSLSLPNPITVAGGAVGGLAAATVADVLHGISDWVAHGVEQVLQTLVSLR